MRASLRKLLLGTTFTTLAAPAIAGDLTVSNAWIRALPGQLPAAGYFTLHNGGARDATLTGAQSAECGMVMLHKSATDNGMAMMMDMPTVPIRSGATVKFAPGGYHLMCTNPSAKLKPGSTASVTLQFEGGTSVTAVFAVRNARGR